jgi:glycosyltransferase involved in cell wall biosynthesis
MLPITGKFWGSLTVIAIAAWQSAAAIASRRRQAEAPREPGPLRVLFLHRDLSSHAGVPRCLLYLARAIDPQRVEFNVGSFEEPSEFMIKALNELEIDPHCSGDEGYLSPAGRLAEIVDRQAIDVIVATTFKAYLCAKKAAYGRPVKVVFWLHAIRGVMNGSIRKAIFACLSRTDPLLFVSRAVRRAHLPRNHRGPQTVIYSGIQDVPPNGYGREMRQVLSLPDDAIVLAYVAEFVECKDHPTAIAAIDALARRDINAHLLLIGVGEEMNRIRKLAFASNVADRIHFLEARSDVRQLLGIVDLYIHPGRDEGFGLAIVEAMLASRAAIAAKSGAIPEFVKSGKTGLLFAPGDAADLTRQIISLIQDHNRAREIGQAARQMCLEKFSPDRFADEIANYLEEIAEIRKGGVATPQLIS